VRYGPSRLARVNNFFPRNDIEANMGAPQSISAAFVGRTTLDLLYWLDELLTEDTKTFARSFRAVPGGPACNAAITHSLLGGHSTLLSTVGRGHGAVAVREELDRRGVRVVDLAAGTPYETPLSTVLIAGAHGTRTIVNPPQSEGELPPLPTIWSRDWGEIPRIILTDGFHLMQALPMLAACHHAGTAIVLDGGSWKPGTAVLAPLLKAAICSERFAVPGQPADPEATLAWFAENKVPHVAVTRGPRSILALDRGRRFKIDIPPIDAVDTTGAGDVLHGAFCYHFAVHGNFEAALRSAAAIATLSCRAFGIDAWAHTLNHP
jgi:sugar/nucleoside kinase (ribokinase family)